MALRTVHQPLRALGLRASRLPGLHPAPAPTPTPAAGPLQLQLRMKIGRSMPSLSFFLQRLGGTCSFSTAGGRSSSRRGKDDEQQEAEGTGVFATFASKFREAFQRDRQLQEKLKELDQAVDDSKTIQKAAEVKQKVGQVVSSSAGFASEKLAQGWEASKPVRDAAEKVAQTIAENPAVAAAADAMKSQVEKASKLVDKLEETDAVEYRARMLERMEQLEREGDKLNEKVLQEEYQAVPDTPIDTTTSSITVVDESQLPKPSAWKRLQTWFGDRADSVFGQTEEAEVMGEIRRKDPEFHAVYFLRLLEKELIPKVLSASLSGDLDVLKPLLADTAMTPLANIVKFRIEHGIYMDPRVLDIRHVQIASSKFIRDEPTLLVSFAAQQVNCIRDAKGKIVEGAEDDIRMNHYIWALRLDPQSTSPKWQIVEMAVQASLPTL